MIRLLGIFTGIIIVIISYIVAVTMKKNKIIYDERQKNSRGKGYAISFYLLIILIILKSFLFTQISFINKFSQQIDFTLILICIAFFIIYCIFHDAYISIYEQPKKVLLTLFILGIVNLLLGLLTITCKKTIEGTIFYNFCVGILLLVICIAIIIRQIQTNFKSE